MFDVNEFLKTIGFVRLSTTIRNKLVCKDGFEMSIQASEYHYCTPRESLANFYSSVEIGYPSESEELLLWYAEDASDPTDTVYGYVPIEVVAQVVEKHGGWDCEYLDIINEHTDK